jgi:hypothetical protein
MNDGRKENISSSLSSIQLSLLMFENNGNILMIIY